MKGAEKRRDPTVFILGAGADIGRELVRRFHSDGWRVVGTYRNDANIQSLLNIPGVTLVHCDIADPTAVAGLPDALAEGCRWDLFFSAVGTMEPIGPFFETDFDAWERSITVNAVAQLRALHALYPFRRSSGAHACLLAGGGTNGPLTNYSAYCVSKIALIKMCELLDDETPDLNTFIIGPGFMRTKIHDETYAAGHRAGPGLAKTEAFMATEGTTYDELYAHVHWCMAQGRSVAGGRNFSTVHDPWHDDGNSLARVLPNSSDGYRLRRNEPVKSRSEQ